MSDLIERAKAWLDDHATDSGAEIFLIRELCEALNGAPPKGMIRYVRPKNGGRGLLRMEQHLRTTPLFVLGDAILVWVNEGDFWAAEPVDVEKIAKDVENDAKNRARYEELKAKFGFEK